MDKKILVLIYTAAHFRALLPLLASLKKMGGNSIYIHFVYSFPNILDQQDLCRQHGFNFQVDNGNMRHAFEGTRTHPVTRFKYRLYNFLCRQNQSFKSLAEKIFLCWNPRYGSVKKYIMMIVYFTIAMIYIPSSFLVFVIMKTILTTIKICKYLKGVLRNYFNKPGRKYFILYLQKMLKIVTLFKFYEFLVSYKNIKGQFAFNRHMLEEGDYNLLLLPEDNVGYLTSIWVKIANSMGMATCVVPFCIANADEIAEVYRSYPQFQINKLTAVVLRMINSAWIYTYKGLTMIRLSLPEILCQEYFRIVPDKPWVMNSGFADAIALESNFMREYYRLSGEWKQSLVVTGSCSDDVLYHAKLNKDKTIEDEYKLLGMAENKPLIICALPVDYMSRKTEFNSYKELCEFIVGNLSRVTNYNVIISLHPSVDSSTLSYLERDNIKITARQLDVLLPACSLFVASISSTIRWAAACGIPVLNYDVYEFRYNDYASAKGIVTVYTKADFESSLNKIIYDKSYYEQLERLQQEISHDWSRLDGLSAKRMSLLFDKLIQHKMSPRFMRKLKLPKIIENEF